MKYKVGDVVKIKSWAQLKKDCIQEKSTDGWLAYPREGYTAARNPIGFNKKMERDLSPTREVAIKDVADYRGCYICWFPGGEWWHIAEGMIDDDVMESIAKDVKEKYPEIWG